MYLVFRSASPESSGSHVIGIEVMATVPKFVTEPTDMCYVDVDNIPAKSLDTYGVKTKNDLVKLLQDNVNYVILNVQVSGNTEIAFSKVSIEDHDEPEWNDVAIPAWQRLIHISHMTTL